MHARANRFRRAALYAAIAALLGVVTLVLSQCTMVGDNITGVGLDRAARAVCKQACQDVHQACLENAAHDCDGTNNECYAAAEAACDAALQECSKNCNHKQGSGVAG
jgi:hypothetical protein